MVASFDGTGLSGRAARLQCVTLLLENGAGVRPPDLTPLQWMGRADGGALWPRRWGGLRRIRCDSRIPTPSEIR